MKHGGDGDKAEELEVEPLLPLAADRRLARAAKELAAEHYPEAWIRRSNEGRKLRATAYFPLESAVIFSLVTVTGMLTGRGVATSIVAAAMFGVGLSYFFYAIGAGFYAGWTGVLAVGNLKGLERDANVVHELGHRMQDSVPGHVEYERAFLARKLGRTPRKWGPRESIIRLARWVVAKVISLVTKGRVDLAKQRRVEQSRGVFHEYVVHERPDDRSFEVFTMGLQGLRFGAKDPETGEFDSNLRPYDDHRELIERMFRELKQARGASRPRLTRGCRAPGERPTPGRSSCIRSGRRRTSSNLPECPQRAGCSSSPLPPRRQSDLLGDAGARKP